MLKAIGLCLGSRDYREDPRGDAPQEGGGLARLRSELEQAKARNAELEKELAEKNGVKGANAGGCGPLVLRIARAAEHDAGSECEGPIPFTSDKSPKRCLNYAKQKLGKTSVVKLGLDVLWQDAYQAGFVARPNDRRSRKGAWSKASYPKLKRANELITRVDGSWCYLGTFGSSGVAGVTLDEWNEFPESMRDAVAAFSGVPRKAGEFEELMRAGRIRVSKYGVRRTGVNAAFRDALLEAGRTAGLNPEEEGDDSDSS